MRRRILSAFLAIAVGLTMASDAWARAGSKSSLGSRGTRTYDRPIERSTTPPPPAAAPRQPVEQAPLASPAAPGAQQPMYRPDAMRQQPGLAAQPMPVQQPGFFQRNPFMAGIMGGLVGAGIGSMLFGHSPALAAASEGAPGASMLGLLLQVALIGGLAWLAIRFFRRRSQPQTAGAPAYERQAEEIHSHNAASPRRVEKEFEVSAADQERFGEVLLNVQKAWSEGNIMAMRAFATPEVVGWMGEDLARDSSRGIRNVIEDVQLVKGEVSETWREEDREYATALLTFTAHDYAVGLADNHVVEGNPQIPTEATEAWTFVRGQGGNWLLSAIEQV